MSSFPSFFEDRLALVIGGGGGIGGCVCQALAKEGCRVILADINLDGAAAIVKSLQGTGHEALQVDVGQAKSVTSLFESISRFSSKPASILVNCAGIGIDPTPFVDLLEKDFDDVIRVNLKGTFLITQAAARAMTAANVCDGAIVNIASFAARLCPPGRCAYVVSKAALVALTKVAAKELGSQGIRVNSVLPALTSTPLSASAKMAAEREKTLAAIPLKRACRPDEVANVIVFLCGPGSSFMTGAALEISGGL